MYIYICIYIYTYIHTLHIYIYIYIYIFIYALGKVPKLEGTSLECLNPKHCLELPKPTVMWSLLTLYSGSSKSLH